MKTPIAHVPGPRYVPGGARLPPVIMTIAEDEIAEYESRACSVCGEPQFSTSAGVTCPQGHLNAATTRT